MIDKVKNENALIVYFKKVESSSRPSEEELNDRLPLRALFEGSDGKIYGIDNRHDL